RLEVKARRFGTALRSGLDSMMEVLSPAGAVLAANDDDQGKDSGLVFTPPADGDFVVRLRDLNSKGGDSFVYCLEIARARPDFQRRCAPNGAMTGPGSGPAWFVRVTRRDGFAGPVAVRVEGLPKGVPASPLTIPPAMTQGVIVLTADRDAPIDATMVRVIGRAALKADDGP